jgi:signal transduction histidine kinase
MRRTLKVSPRPRRRAERRRSPVVPGPCGPPEDRLFKGIRRALLRALERLRRTSGIGRAWRRPLRRLSPSRKEYEALAGMDLAGCYRHLASAGRGEAPRSQSKVASGHASPSGGAKDGRYRAGDEAYCLAVDRRARILMRAGVPEDQAIAAVALYLEVCLAHLSDRAEVRAVVRLASATQRILAVAYGEERSAGLNRLDDQERQKLSADLHDEVGADLIVLKLYVELIAVKLAKGRGVPLGPKLREALVLIGHAIESVRRLTLDLGPALLDLGFLPAVRLFLRQFSTRTRIKVVLEEEGTPVSLTASHETALYRVLRGALSNVAKHSQAKNVTVTLRHAPDLFVMTITDDGAGFDVLRQDPDQSFGLTAMRERIRGLRGRLHIESRAARRRGDKSGTRVEVHLPLRKKAT